MLVLRIVEIVAPLDLSFTRHRAARRPLGLVSFSFGGRSIRKSQCDEEGGWGLRRRRERGRLDLQAASEFLSTVSRFELSFRPRPRAAHCCRVAVLFLSGKEGCRASYEFSIAAETIFSVWEREVQRIRGRPNSPHLLFVTNCRPSKCLSLHLDRCNKRPASREQTSNRTAFAALGGEIISRIVPHVTEMSSSLSCR